MLGFENLQARLLTSLRDRVRSGQATERGLANSSGLSQPHLHNILKGIRHLTPVTSDLLLRRLSMTLVDLLDIDELRHALFQRLTESVTAAEVPVLKGRLGPGFPWPDEKCEFECVKVPVSYVMSASRAAVARLGPDPAMEPILSAGDLVLVDDSALPADPHPQELFAIEHSGGVAVRWIRRGRTASYLLSAANHDEPVRWPTLEAWVGARVRGRVVPLRWMHHKEVLYDPLLPPRATSL